MNLKPRALMLASSLALIGTGLLATPASADTIIQVTIPQDTAATPDGECSLREAIMSADYNFHKFSATPDECASGTGNDTINLPTDTYLLTIGDAFVDPEPVPGTGDLDIFEEIGGDNSSAMPVLTINGNGSVVDADGLNHVGIPAPDHVFQIFGVTVVMNDLTIQGGGNFSGMVANVAEGGGVFVDAAPPDPAPSYVAPGGALELNRSVVRGNNAGQGGGIYNDGGHVELIGGTVVGPNNDATIDGGGIWTRGGATLIVQDSTVEENTAGTSGGGIYSLADDVTLERSTVNDNTAADGFGGGIYLSGAAGLLTATNSTIVGNDAFDLPPASNPDGLGGGIYVTGGGFFELHFVTIANNHAQNGGGNIGLGDPGGHGSVDNTIIANGTIGEAAAQNCSLDGSSDIESFGLNLSDLSQDSDGTSLTSCRLDGASDLTGENPGLGDLEDNGGLTETRELNEGSPAVDSAGVSCIATDQRGESRPQDGDGNGSARCDRGAFEREGQGGGAEPPPAPPTPPVDECTITGTTGDDILLGTDAGETICGLAGNDVIRAGGGDDQAFGNEGDDTFEGGAGNDSLTGGPGTDTGDYSGAPGSVDADLVRGTAVGVGASTDNIFELENLIGSSFQDHLRGDAGANVLIGNASADVIVGRGGPDLLRGKGGNDDVSGSDGKDLLKGGGDEDRLRGGQDDDRLGGGAQDDRLLGNEGDDTILGWAGDDYLNGKSGNDSCDGGVGNNTLVNCET